MSRQKAVDVIQPGCTLRYSRAPEGRATEWGSLRRALLVSLAPLLLASPGAASGLAYALPATVSGAIGLVYAASEDELDDEFESESKAEELEEGAESEAEEAEETESEHEDEAEADEAAEHESEREDQDRDQDREESRGTLAADSDREDDLDLDDEGFDVLAGEVMAIDLDESTLEHLKDDGYAIVRREVLAGLDLTLVTLRIPEGDDLDEAIERLRAILSADAVDYNHIYRTARAAQVPTSGVTPLEAAVRFNLNQPRASHAPFRVGLIDTAIDLKHPALRQARIRTLNFSGQPHSSLQDHGTAVASLLAGYQANRFSGLAPEAEIWAAEVFHQLPDGESVASAEAVVRGLDWLLKEGVRVINISLAGPPNVLLEIAVRKALERGHILVAAAGNDGPAAPPAWPAAYDGVIAVTAIGPDFQVYRRAGRGPHLDFAAPGIGILTARHDGQYGVVEGTSFAAPFASVLIARHIGKSRSPAGPIIERFRTDAKDLGRPGFDQVFGYGLIQPVRESSNDASSH